MIHRVVCCRVTAAFGLVWFLQLSSAAESCYCCIEQIITTAVNRRQLCLQSPEQDPFTCVVVIHRWFSLSKLVRLLSLQCLGSMFYWCLFIDNCWEELKTFRKRNIRKDPVGWNGHVYIQVFPAVRAEPVDVRRRYWSKLRCFNGMI